MAEHSGNDTDGPGTHTVLDPLTEQEAVLWQRYDDSYGYPFLDIGNKVLVLSPNFSPGLLSGLDQLDIASRLSDAGEPSTQGIVGTANYLTAAICATTGQRPAVGLRQPRSGEGRTGPPVEFGSEAGYRGRRRVVREPPGSQRTVGRMSEAIASTMSSGSSHTGSSLRGWWKTRSVKPRARQRPTRSVKADRLARGLSSVLPLR